LGQNPGIGSSNYSGSFQLSKPGLEQMPIIFSITESKRKISTLGVYPNPFRHQIQIPESVLGSRYQIFNLQGKPIKSGMVEKSVLEVADLRPGLYQLEFSSPKSGDRKTVRIVKE
jgi:hypothetical protein